MSDIVAQVAIFVIGPVAIWLANYRITGVRRWGSLVGLSSQPFWFWTTYSHHQWAVLATCFIYTYAWARGVYNQWIKP